MCNMHPFELKICLAKKGSLNVASTYRTTTLLFVLVTRAERTRLINRLQYDTIYFDAVLSIIDPPLYNNNNVE